MTTTIPNKSLRSILAMKLQDAFFLDTNEEGLFKNDDLLFAMNQIFDSFNALVRFVLAVLQEDELCFLKSKLQDWSLNSSSSCEKIMDFCADQTWITVEQFLTVVLIPHHGRQPVLVRSSPDYNMRLEFLVRSLVGDKDKQDLKHELWMWFRTMLQRHDLPLGISDSMTYNVYRSKLQQAKNYNEFASALNYLELSKNVEDDD